MSTSVVRVIPDEHFSHHTRWRITVTTPSLKVYETLFFKPTSEGAMTVFEARTIWKNERRLFRRLADVK